MISLGNGTVCGGGLPVTPLAQPDDGKIDITLIKRMPRYKLPYLFSLFLKRRIYDIIKYVKHIRCEEATVNMVPSLPLNIDGEVIESMPFTVRIVPGGLTVFVP